MHYVNHDKEWFLSALSDETLIEKLKKIKLIISDIDGCLTDGKVYYPADGNCEIKKCFCIQDGYLMTKCNKEGMPSIALISGRSDKAAAERAAKLGIPEGLYHQGIDHKKSVVVKNLLERLNIPPDETIFFGDDLLDLEAKAATGLFAVPSNGMFYVQAEADIIVPRTGGNGSLRLLLDLILYVQEKHIAQETITKALNNKY